ncbi:universal stress protein [Litchfieldia salsa]|uniref:Nucleotide-binding universal stress protein, UspA family n=1 Tax=Litchfieldia salsa TaxID=930152 RepID=A0A1H0WT24_9BACI|nr:universal stress protein [Litchfieldia salsa]SDP93843.1 Nucleotide-binding universal stress protein, UspA family [Litchfieldia salsa]
MFKKILLASDGSEHAIRAAEKAVYLISATTDSTIEIIYVIDASTSKADVLHSTNPELSRKQRLIKTEEIINQSKIEYKVTVLHGEAGPTIVDYANKNEFDLVVIGSRGLNTLQEMVLGSVSHKVAKRVECPVLIVK